MSGAESLTTSLSAHERLTPLGVRKRNLTALSGARHNELAVYFTKAGRAQKQPRKRAA